MVITIRRMETAIILFLLPVSLYACISVVHLQLPIIKDSAVRITGRLLQNQMNFWWLYTRKQEVPYEEKVR